MPAGADTQVDYEGELAVVIGASASNVAAADAWQYVAALTSLNDVSARDVQAGGGTIGLLLGWGWGAP